MVGVLVRLREQAEAKGGDGIVAPAAVQAHEQLLVLARIERTQPPAQWLQLLRRDEDHVQVLHHDRGELQVRVRLEDLGEHAEHALGLQVGAQLAHNQAAPRLEQLAVRGEQLEQVRHEHAEMPLVRLAADLDEEAHIA